ncbi:MAG: hypothetical protein QW139_01490, partial [Candidatus Micrarchaeaceae archaeon]
KTNGSVIFPDGQVIPLDTLERVVKRRKFNDCFLVDHNSLLHLYVFENYRTYKLYEPHMDWPPTLQINGGSLMHTVSVSKPTDEAKNKVDTLGRISGNILDCCFGLGYTAIELIKRGADSVDTFELSEGVIEIAKANPWSNEAFQEKRITLKNKDIVEAITKIDDNYYNSILHDPPNVKIEGNLYSKSFYGQLYRVLKRGGTLYHFVGGGRSDLEYKVNYIKGVMERLSDVGFKVHKSYRGVLAIKP